MDRSNARGEREQATAGLTLSEDDMRRLGYRAVDLIVERWTSLRDDAAWAGGTRGDMESLFREPAPEEGMDALEVMEAAAGEILPRAARIDHPRFFAFVPSSPTWPTVMADLLTSGFNVFQGTWLGSAGPSQVELVVLDWFREWLGLPETAGGLFTSGGSAANLNAVVTARESRGHPADPVLYVSDQAHSSMSRAARIAGFGENGVRTVPTDGDFRLDVDALRRALREDREAGRNPLMVCGNGGATNTGVVDSLAELGALCREEGLWFHVDGAYGGFAILADAGRAALDGIELADSVTLDPHKWLFQTFDTGCLLVRDTAELEAAFRVTPEYLQDTDLGFEHVNFGDRGLQLTRSFRALKVWMAIRTFGLRAFREAIRRSIELAREAERYVVDSTHLELLSPASLGVVCYRFNPTGHALDAARLENLNTAIQAGIVASGYAMISSTRLRGAYSLRLCVMNYTSTLEDVEGTLRAVEEAGRELLA